MNIITAIFKKIIKFIWQDYILNLLKKGKYFTKKPTALVIVPVIKTTPKIIRNIPEMIRITLICLLIFLKNPEKRLINILNIIKGIPSPRE